MIVLIILAIIGLAWAIVASGARADREMRKRFREYQGRAK